MDVALPGIAPRRICGTSPLELRRARGGQSRWTKTALTWAVADWLGGLTQQMQLEAYAWAWQQWAEVTPLTFTLIDDPRRADIILNTRPIDGTGGTLAEMQLPPGNDQQLRGWFDVAEKWNKGHVELKLTALHEFGHAIGLGHDEDAQAVSIMDAIYNDALRQLQPRDIARAQAVYGKPPAVKPTPEPGPPIDAPKKNQATATIVINGVGTFRGTVDKII